MGPSGQDEWLQRLFDGDLDAEARAAAEQRLAQDPEAQKELRSLQRLSTLMAASFEEQTQRLDSAALFARITAEIDAAPAADPAPASQPVSRESWWRRLIGSGAVMPVGGAVALVAAVLLTFYPPGGGPGEGDDASGAGGRAVGNGPRALHLALATEIVQVDFGGSTGTVFEIALKDGAVNPVVWINDEE